jgi:hypothetical protein
MVRTARLRMVCGVSIHFYLASSQGQEQFHEQRLAVKKTGPLVTIEFQPLCNQEEGGLL